MNMQAIGRKISSLRKERDMTQVDLADKLGVTYQAVSSWERGNSMPDIAKLPDISQVLNVSIDELLGNEKAIEFVKNVLTGQTAPPPDAEILAEVAPILKPSQVESYAKDTRQHDAEAFDNAEVFVNIAPYVSSETLVELALNSNIDSGTIRKIAHHLDSEDLMEIALHCTNLDIEAIRHFACHMDSEDLKAVVLHCANLNIETVQHIAVHMDSEDLVEVAAVLIKNHGLKAFVASDIAKHHLDEEDLAELVQNAMGNDRN